MEFVFLLFQELFPGGQHAAASIALWAWLQKTPTLHPYPVFSVTVIPPDIELLRTNKCTGLVSLCSIPALCTPSCCFSQLSPNQITNPNHSMVLLHKGLQTVDVECKSLSTREILIYRERTHFTTMAMLLLYASSTPHLQILLYPLRISRIFSSLSYKHHHSLHSRQRNTQQAQNCQLPPHQREQSQSWGKGLISEALPELPEIPSSCFNPQASAGTRGRNKHPPLPAMLEMIKFHDSKLHYCTWSRK